MKSRFHIEARTVEIPGSTRLHGTDDDATTTIYRSASRCDCFRAFQNSAAKRADAFASFNECNSTSRCGTTQLQSQIDKSCGVSLALDYSNDVDNSKYIYLDILNKSCQSFYRQSQWDIAASINPKSPRRSEAELEKIGSLETLGCIVRSACHLAIKLSADRVERDFQ